MVDRRWRQRGLFEALLAGGYGSSSRQEARCARRLIDCCGARRLPDLHERELGVSGRNLGGLTRILDAQFPGVGLQAVIGTLSVFAVTLVLFKSGKVRATPKAMRFFMIAIIGYAVFSLINLVMMWTGAVQEPFGLRTSVEIFGIPLGVFIGLLAIGLAAFSLIMDFTSIEAGVQSGAPQRFSWTAAFGLTVTLVWLYVEIIRLLAILRGDD